MYLHHIRINELNNFLQCAHDLRNTLLDVKRKIYVLAVTFCIQHIEFILSIIPEFYMLACWRRFPVFIGFDLFRHRILYFDLHQKYFFRIENFF